MSDRDATPAWPHWLTGAPGDWARCRDRVVFPSHAQALELAVSLSRAVPGNIVEFGTGCGCSTRIIRDELWWAKLWDRHQWGKRIYTCDAFPAAVPRLAGVRIVQGPYARTLTPSLAVQVSQVSLAHLHSDRRSPTAPVLEWLRPMLVPGSLLLFDEFLGEEPAEARAFTHWAGLYGIRTELVALFVREPSGAGTITDRRALFQIVGEPQVRPARPLFPVRLRRRFAATW